jgi:multidrug efflux system outer membrane protein
LKRTFNALWPERAVFWPEIGTTDSYQRQRESKNQPLLGSLSPASVPVENNVYQAGFDASWELDVFGGTRRATEAARAEIAAAEFNQRSTYMTLLAEVARNYVQARGYQQQLGIAQENIEAQEQSLAITQRRFTNGLAPNLDVQQAQTLLSTTCSEIPSLESDLESTVHRLGVLLAQPPGALSEELASSAPIPAAAPKVPVGLPSQLLQRLGMRFNEPQPFINAARNLCKDVSSVGITQLVGLIDRITGLVSEC